jgi:hypothetical protein
MKGATSSISINSAGPSRVPIFRFRLITTRQQAGTNATPVHPRRLPTKINISGQAAMNRKETHQITVTNKTGSKAMSAVDAISLDEETRRYAQKLFKLRVMGWGNETSALNECALWFGMSPRSFKRLKDGETKKAASFFARARKAYLDYCARKAAELLADVEEEKARFGNVRIGDLDQEVEALVAKINAARSLKLTETRGD